MTKKDIKGKEWETVIDNIEGLSSLPTKSQLQSILRVFSKASFDLGEELENTASIIQDFNSSTSRLTKVIIWLNTILALSAIVQIILKIKS